MNKTKKSTGEAGWHFYFAPMSTEMVLPKKALRTLGRKGLRGLEYLGVYQMFYQLHFLTCLEGLFFVDCASGFRNF